eukprot:155138-Chlamydomonas_euryale.AAC.3
MARRTRSAKYPCLAIPILGTGRLIVGTRSITREHKNSVAQNEVRESGTQGCRRNAPHALWFFVIKACECCHTVLDSPRPAGNHARMPGWCSLLH